MVGLPALQMPGSLHAIPQQEEVGQHHGVMPVSARSRCKVELETDITLLLALEMRHLVPGLLLD